MANGAGIGDRKLQERLADRLREHPEILSGTLCAAGAFLSAMAMIIGESAPFGAAFAAAVPQAYLLPSVLGAAAGYLVAGVGTAYRSIGALLLIAAVRLIVGRYRWEARPSWCAPVIAGSAVLAAGVAPVFYSDPLVYDMIMWTTQVMMASAAAGFMERAFEDRSLPRSLPAGDRMASAAAVVLGAVALMGLDAIAFYGVSAGRIAAAAIVLAAAKAGGERTSALAGVVCGLVIGFSTGKFDLYVTSYGLGGLLAGLFSSFGRTGSAMTFALAYGFLGLLSQQSPSGFIEVALASAAFLMLPESVCRVFAGAESAAAGEGAFRAVAQQRLHAVAAALRDIADVTQQVSVKLNNTGTSPETIYRRVSASVCRRCACTSACWRENPETTKRALSVGLALLRQKGSLEGCEFPGALSRCNRRDMLAEALSAEYERWQEKEERRRAGERLRTVMTEQYDGLSMAIDAVAEDIGLMKPAAAAAAQSLHSILEEEGLEPRRLFCWKDEHGRVAIKAAVPKYRAAKADSAELTDKLSAAAGVRFAPPHKKESGGEMLLEYAQKPIFRIEYGYSQSSPKGERCCGDSLRQLNSGGMAHLLLSDGMGSGGAAALDSALASSLAACLLEADIDYQSALRLINSSLLVRSGEESLATLDATRIDLYSGVVSIYKAGAAPTLLMCGGKVREISAGSLPAGILGGVEFETAQYLMGDGDMVLMMSDGASQESVEWMKPMLQGGGAEDLPAFCRRVAKTAQLRRLDGREDDITVAALRLVKL